MKSATVTERAQAWVVDYSAARTQAIRWLGERYLLAKPINARAAPWSKTVAGDDVPAPPMLESKAA